MVVEKGQNVELSLVVCADPRPRVVAWEWGSSRLEAGSEMGMYVCMLISFCYHRLPIVYMLKVSSTFVKSYRLFLF